MNVSVESSGSVAIAYLSGEIDHHCAVQLRNEIDDAICKNKPTHLIIDFRNVTFMDSSGIGLVMGRYRLLQSVNTTATLEIRSVSSRTKKIMELAGLGRIAIIKEKENEKN